MLLLFEVGIEVDLVRIRREARSLLAVAPLQVVFTTAVCWAAFGATGSPPLGAALLGLSIAMSSSVVVVNITRSRRRTTDRETERALLGWSVVQDVAGVSIAAVILALFGVNGRSATEALGGLAVFAVLAIGAAWLLPMILRRLRGEHDLFLIVSVASGLTLAAVGSVLFGIPMALAAFVAAWRSARAMTRPRRAVACYRSATSSRSSSSLRSAACSIPQHCRRPCPTWG